eukprot:4523953-Amphidinium_carterae.1
MEGEGLLGSVQAPTLPYTHECGSSLCRTEAITATEVGVSAHATAASVSLTVLLVTAHNCTIAVVLAVFGFIYRAKHDSGSPSHVTIAVEPGDASHCHNFLGSLKSCFNEASIINPPDVFAEGGSPV